MKGKLLQRLIAVVLVLCLTATNFIFVATSTVYALSTTTELEGGKIIFEAYFKNGDQKVTEKTANISEGDKLYLNLELKAGKLQDAKIKIDNANFKIMDDKVNNKFINNINTKTNEIALNEINYNDSKNGVIEIELPIKFEEAEKIPTSYFARENSINLSGKYKNSSENAKNIQSDTIKTKLTWAQQTDGINYSTKIEKVIYFDNKTLVQANIQSTYKGAYFPKETETVTVNLPKIDNITPSYTVLVDGNKLDVNQITDSIETQTMSFTNNFIDDENITWNKSGNSYKVIYVYDGITKLEDPLQIQPKIETKLFNNDKKLTGSPTYKSNKPQGTIASVSAKSTSGDVYKGYMYANSEETRYSEEYNMEMSYVDGITSTFELAGDKFKTQDGEEISTNNQTEYKEIRINKEKLVKVLGTKGSLKIIPDNKELSEFVINSTSSADENGNIVINNDRIKGSHNVTIQVTSAENPGTLTILATKAIKGNAGYEKDTLKTINAIETTIKSYTDNVEGTSTASATTGLKETVTQATITMNNNNILSTTSTNNIEFIATLKTGTMDTDLLKEPTVKIILPDEVTKIELSSVSALYAEKELKIASAQVVDNNKAILVKLDGEQFKYNNKFIEGIKITVNAQITLNDSATSRDTKITMKYTNENSANKEYTATTDVSVQAPYGIIKKAAISAYFETENNGTETLTTRLINNYGKSVENIAIIGTMPSVKLSKNEFEKGIKDSFQSSFSSDKNKKANIEIKYSQDEENFNDSFENAKLYKIILKDNKLESKEMLGIKFTLNISQILPNFKLSYIYDSDEKVENLQINEMTSGTSKNENKKPETSGNTGTEEQSGETRPTNPTTPTTPNAEKDENLRVGLNIKSGNTELKDGDEIFAGQTIRYTYKILNNTGKEVKNIKLVVNHENANIFEEQTEQQTNTARPDEKINFTYEVETEKSSKEYTIGTMKDGETKTITYQVRVKEGVQQTKVVTEVQADGMKTLKSEKSNKVKSAQLKLGLTNNVSKEIGTVENNIFANTFEIKNTSNETLKDISVKFTIPKEFEYVEVYELDPSNNYQIIQQDKNYLVFNVKELASGATKELNVSLRTIDGKPEEESVSINYTATVNNNTYYSNEVDIALKQALSTKLETKQVVNATGILKTGDKLIYKIAIKNVGENSDGITIEDFVPEAAVVKNAYYTIGDKQTKIENITDNAIVETITIDKNQQADVYIETEIDEAKTGKEEITNYATLVGNYLEKEIKTNEVTHKLQANIQEDSETTENPGSEEEPGTEENPGTTENPGSEEKPGTTENPGSTTNPGTTGNSEGTGTIPAEVEMKGSISGVAWLDENKNGIRETNEKMLSGIKVSLANVATGKYVTNSQGNKLEVTTNANGEYIFENIPNGKYIVTFLFDNTKYRNTEYRVSGATEKTNSDIITSKISSNDDDIKYGITDTLELTTDSLENVDAGFIENEIFDLSLQKYVTKVTVQNTSGTVVKEYSNEQLAKLEIDAKNIAGSTVLIEYSIRVKNEGEIAGYANEIIDYIPKDLTFSSEINKNWYTSTDGYLHTTALSKQIINPGETETIKLVLVKTMTENNTGLTSNKAEIAKSSNDLSIPDKDSKAGNAIQGEDDISEAELIISIRTGIGYTIGTIVAIIALTATGIIVYTKKRKGVNHNAKKIDKIN